MANGDNSLIPTCSHETVFSQPKFYLSKKLVTPPPVRLTCIEKIFPFKFVFCLSLVLFWRRQKHDLVIKKTLLWLPYTYLLITSKYDKFGENRTHKKHIFPKRFSGDDDDDDVIFSSNVFLLLSQSQQLLSNLRQNWNEKRHLTFEFLQNSFARPSLFEFLCKSLFATFNYFCHIASHRVKVFYFGRFDSWHKSFS